MLRWRDSVTMEEQCYSVKMEEDSVNMDGGTVLRWRDSVTMEEQC